MRLSSPTLGIDQDASPDLIKEVVLALPGRADPFAILAMQKLTFVQTCWTPEGFVFEYQIGSVDQHFVANTLLTADEVVKAFSEFLAGSNEWCSRYEFSPKKIRGVWFRIGHTIGSFFGSLVRGFREARKRSAGKT
jgi:hypothetical protein